MYQKITLDNGVRIVSQHIPNMHSAAIGIWVGTGSRHEKASENGYSHFIEHMVFKGTETRSAADIASLMDGVGGQVNAFTTKECTCFYARVLGSHVDRALDILCDMFFSSQFDDADVETERGVILEEIDMYADSPDDLVTERLFSGIYRGTPLSRPILGKPPVLKAADGAALRRFMQENYRPDAIVVSIAGCFSEKDLDRIKACFAPMVPRPEKPLVPASYTPFFTTKKKPVEQNHLCLAFPSLSYNHPDRYALQILNGILGSGMSSRLFQKVREERGLCYSVYSFLSAHSDIGIFGVYTALGRETEREAMSVICDEIRKISQDGITEQELTRTREQTKANILMSLESTVSRMNSLARGELFLGRVESPEEIIERYDSVRSEDVCRLANELFQFDRASFSAVGRVSDKEEYYNWVNG